MVALSKDQPTPEEQLASDAMALYEQRLRSQLEPQHNGKFVVINVDTGEFELGDDDVVVSDRAQRKFGKARQVTLRVGRRAAYRIGGFFPERT